MFCSYQVEEKIQDGADSRIIECETCQYETQIPVKGLSDLLQEYVLTDLIEMSDIEDTQIICTSCKAKESAEARCQDCANFLCPNCVIAHQFMRCFENHKASLQFNYKYQKPSLLSRQSHLSSRYNAVD